MSCAEEAYDAQDARPNRQFVAKCGGVASASRDDLLN